MAFLTAALAAGKITISGTEVKGDYPGDSQWAAGTYLFYTLRQSTSHHVGRIDYSNGNFTLLPNDTYLEHPVVYVTWFGAWAFADFYGYRLPTEQEWEKAARGNTGYDYPWGNSITGSRVNYWQSGDPFSEGTTPVGYYNGQAYGSFQTTDSPSPYGAYDMAGNVYQWTNSFYGGGYPRSRVLRGGSWHNLTSGLRSWDRYYNNPSFWYYGIGFRCARTQ
jgi:formylglycine-generating enzyme required for sulfatase activity